MSEDLEPREPTSWSLSAELHDPHLTLERYGEICFLLGRLHEEVRFAMGDAIVKGEMHFGEECYQMIEHMNLSEEARREYVRVSTRVPRSRRRKDLSWSHHRAVAALEPVKQKAWLKRASEEQLSHHALRLELREAGDSLPASPALSQCRCCGRPL